MNIKEQCWGMNQNFDSVEQVAGRDIVNNHPQEKPESQLQADFFRNTGIWCPRPARDTLEWLMEDHGFTAKELRIAWKANSISTDPDRHQIKTITPWFEAVFGWAMLALISLYFLMIALPLIIKGNQHDWREPAALVVEGLVYLGLVWIIARTSVIPRRVAIRAQRKLGLENQ